MPLPVKPVHPSGESNLPVISELPKDIEVDTYAGKLHIEWDPDAAVTPIGQLPFFIQFLKSGGRFDPWIEDCPLIYHSNNAPQKIDVFRFTFFVDSVRSSTLCPHNQFNEQPGKLNLIRHEQSGER